MLLIVDSSSSLVFSISMRSIQLSGSRTLQFQGGRASDVEGFGFCP